jgi:hypothetical protein
VDAYNPAAYEYQFPETWQDEPLHIGQDGLVRVTVAGTDYTNPVSSAQYALAALAESEDLPADGRQELIELAARSADDVLTMADSDGRFPYLFPWVGPDGLPAPIPSYSAMAEGQMLSVFIRLHELTGERKWLRAGERTFGNLSKIGTESPAVSFVDNTGSLWLEEHSLTCPGRVFNGHMFAAFGLYDYANSTGDMEARRLFLAAATTILDHALSLREPDGISHYGASQRTMIPFYHAVHIAQIQILEKMTADARFAGLAQDLISDGCGRNAEDSQVCDQSR